MTSPDVLTEQLINGDIMSLWYSVTDTALIATRSQEQAAFAFEYHKIIKREIEFIGDNRKGAYKTKIVERIARKSDLIVTSESRLTRDELLVIFEHCIGNTPKSPNKFTSMLKHRGIITERMRNNDGVTYGFKVEWRVSQEWLEERLAEFKGQQPTTKLARVK